jgi:hypothetical protein
VSGFEQYETVSMTNEHAIHSSSPESPNNIVTKNNWMENEQGPENSIASVDVVSVV